MASAESNNTGAIAPRYLHQFSKPPYRSDRGLYMLKSLFYETQNNKQELVCPISDDLGGRPIFTLKHYDWEINPDSPMYRKDGCNLLRSFYELYLEHEDPSEYSFATKVLGSYDHWKKLSEAAFFREHLVEFREALSVKIESKAIQAAHWTMENGLGPQALQAAKWLHDKVRRTPPGNKRGRPSNHEVESELKRIVEEQADLQADLERIKDI